MGLSGSGKSTLVRHFNRLLEPTAGKIEIHGTDVMALGPSELMEFRNRKIGMVFQNFALLPHRSVLDNVAMPLEIRNINKNERMRRAAKMLKTVELDAWGNKFAHELSGGMQQRVGLARALAADPEVLLMDEPFSALDPLIRRQLQDEFVKLSAVMKKTTCLLPTTSMRPYASVIVSPLCAMVAWCRSVPPNRLSWSQQTNTCLTLLLVFRA